MTIWTAFLQSVVSLSIVSTWVDECIYFLKQEKNKGVRIREVISTNFPKLFKNIMAYIDIICTIYLEKWMRLSSRMGRDIAESINISDTPF